jgi:hypothetical protein
MGVNKMQAAYNKNKQKKINKNKKYKRNKIPFLD